jgi:hypothetical protein
MPLADWPLTVSKPRNGLRLGSGAPLLSCSPPRSKPMPICALSRPVAARIGTRVVAVWPLAPLIVTLVRYIWPVGLLPLVV